MVVGLGRIVLTRFVILSEEEKKRVSEVIEGIDSYLSFLADELSLIDTESNFVVDFVNFFDRELKQENIRNYSLFFIPEQNLSSRKIAEAVAKEYRDDKWKVEVVPARHQRPDGFLVDGYFLQLSVDYTEVKEIVSFWK